MIQFQIEKGIPLPPPPMPVSPTACKWCNKRERQGGYKTCDVCRASVKASYKARRAQGMCGWGTSCPNRSMEGHSMCEEHFKRSGAVIRKLLDGRVAQGLCRRCGSREIAGTKNFCLICYQTAAGGFYRPARSPIPPSIRKLVRQFWRLDRIDQRRAQAEIAIQSIRGERAREIISLRQGLVDGIDYTLEETGERFGVTRERIRQIETKVYRKLQAVGVAVDLLIKPSDIQRPTKRDRRLTPHEKRKQECHRLVAEALQDGRLRKLTCRVCGNVNSIAHHPDYSKPLDVEWLCRRHHAVAHGKKLQTKTKNRRYIAPPWLIKAKAEATDADYNALEIIEVFIRHDLKMKDVSKGTGISVNYIRRIVRGQHVKAKVLTAMLRYVEHLKTQQLQIAA